MEKIMNKEIPEGMKRCCKCKEVRPLSDFSKRNDTKDGKRYDCKKCKKERSKKQLSTNPLQRRKKRLYKNYRITPEYYNNLFIEQEGKCAICGTHQDNLKRPLAVDHNHKTKKIRGLLCINCNAGIGYLKEDYHILLKAVEYLL